MLHNEARELLVRAFEMNHDASEVAKIFPVSTSTVYRLTQQKKNTGSVVLRVNQRGRKPILTETDLLLIRKEIQEHNYITIEEIRQRLLLKASYSAVARVHFEYCYNKKPSDFCQRVFLFSF